MNYNAQFENRTNYSITLNKKIYQREKKIEKYLSNFFKEINIQSEEKRRYEDNLDRKTNKI